MFRSEDRPGALVCLGLAALKGKKKIRLAKVDKQEAAEKKGRC